MARVPYLNKDDLEPDDRVLLDRPANIFRALVNSPKGARAFARHGNYILSRSKLDPRLRELAIIQVGYSTNSPYEYSHHVEIGRQNGVSDDDIRAIAEESAGGESHLGELERAVLSAAREITNDVSLSDDTFAVLEAALDSESLVDLILAISFYNGASRTLNALEVDVEDSYLHYLEEFPLPAD
ncbi:MAG: carboxymuconolactone decarboxylase family protein [Chloroflexi bacterium]|nr:carboxymuconolactone decarboxylase family protein [Chloroflexota bacterium]